MKNIYKQGTFVFISFWVNLVVFFSYEVLTFTCKVIQLILETIIDFMTEFMLGQSSILLSNNAC